jgi:WD40 repeat protein
VTVWKVDTGSAVFDLVGHTDTVKVASFSPHGKWIATASADQTVRLWDVGTRATVAVLSGHRDAVLGVAFSPDGKRLVTASADTTARIYPWELFAPPEDLLATAATRVTRQLTPEERERFLHESPAR